MRSCKRQIPRPVVIAILVGFAGLLPANLAAQETALRPDGTQSRFWLELGRAGLLKMFGDDHQIRVNRYDCLVLFDGHEPTRSSVQLLIHTDALEVLDPHLDPERRAEVQKRMEGPEVLDITRYPQITFSSRRVIPLRGFRYNVVGDLRIRDITRPVSFEVTFVQEDANWRATGEARVHQKPFGIQPVSAGAGMVKVKDEITIKFDLVLVPGQH